ncbi:hypothetical protein ACF0H5_004595 [Mactra antiquata]
MESLSSLCTDASFEDIYSYKFINNDKFMEGWRKVRSVSTKDKMLESLIKAQTFFFSREIRQVRFQEYWTWLKKSEKNIQDLDFFTADGIMVSTDQTASSIDTVISDNVSEPSTSNTDGMNCTDNVHNESNIKRKISDFKESQCSQMSETGNIVQNTGDSVTVNKSVKHPATFLELIEMIQAGIKLPDTDDLDIHPLNEDPTPCDSERPIKPWEVS